MNFGQLLTTIQDYKRSILDLEVLTNLFNDSFGDWLASQGVSRLDMLGDNLLHLNVRGTLKQENPITGIKLYPRSFVVSLDEVTKDPESIADALTCYSSDGDGAYVWIVPDGYMAALTPAEQEWETHGGGYFSHESICISNTADRGTCCLLEVLYEDPTLENVSCEFEVPAQRSVHYRLDKLKREDGEPLIAKDAPVSYKITSRDTRVVVQGSRILTSGESSMFASFGTVMAWCPQ
jgi:hypothetical protein